MKQLTVPNPFARSHRRLTGATLLVLGLIAVRAYFSPQNSLLEQREGAERLASDLPAVTQMNPDPRKSFATSLGRTLTSGIDIAGVHITVQTWDDVDRTHLKLLGAVLNIPMSFFVDHPTFSGCDQLSYTRGQCRFDLDFSSGSLQIVNTQPSAAHNYKTSEVGNGSSLHL